ncbi:unnamed protein product [Schistosoma turkestanicum]|nr:unnamed protein product [Schistosoma turkestanicum]
MSPCSLIFSIPGKYRTCIQSFKLCSNLRAMATATQKPNQSDDPIMKAESLANQYEEDVTSSVAKWLKANEIYYGKERDFNNYPTYKAPYCHPKVRMGVFPDSWFQPFYNKTGVTGPYMFLFGSFMFLMNKEIWIYDGHWFEFIVFCLVCTGAIKKLGPHATKFIEKLKEEHDQAMYYQPLNEVKGYVDNTIKTCETEIARAAVVPEHILAKKENIALQLEATYRERLQNVYRTVQRRLLTIFSYDKFSSSQTHIHIINDESRF